MLNDPPPEERDRLAELLDPIVRGPEAEAVLAAVERLAAEDLGELLKNLPKDVERTP